MSWSWGGGASTLWALLPRDSPLCAAIDALPAVIGGGDAAAWQRAVHARAAARAEAAEAAAAGETARRPGGLRRTGDRGLEGTRRRVHFGPDMGC